MTVSVCAAPLPSPSWHAGPLASHINWFAGRLAEQGYAPFTAQEKLRLVTHLSQNGSRSNTWELTRLTSRVSASFSSPASSKAERPGTTVLPCRLSSMSCVTPGCSHSSTAKKRARRARSGF